ncbi:MAG: ion transporter [Bacteroidetes bacterium]|jgi:voltage-gated potassium channel|nr:ion transporter [Bacteroidota bacterium]
MSTDQEDHKEFPAWRKKVHEVIFEADTPMGKLFDVVLFILIILSVIVVMLESVEDIKKSFGNWFYTIELVFTCFFTIEYVARIISVKKPRGYIFSFYGVVDLLSILPTYISIFLPGSHSLMTIRTLRLLRIFRVLKLAHFMKEAASLQRAFRASRHKITIFMFSVVSIVVITGTIMYLIEPPESGFTSIPQSIYWSIVTLTTVGYGDIAPTTVFGQFFASLIMIMGYAIIAVPTGIMSAEIAKEVRYTNTTACPSCSREGHADDARFCKYCGADLELEV